MTRILDAARWAPSGDNTQPWRFEIQGDDRLLVHGSDTRDWCVYDLEGHASQIAVGALLENISIAASQEGVRAECQLAPNSTDTHPVIEINFLASEAISPDPLFKVMRQRCTQRRALSWSALDQADRTALEESVGPGYSVHWVEGFARKWRIARLLFRNAQIRLTIKEAYEVHKRIIEWNAGFSEDRIPDRALGLDPLAMLLMRWAIKSWGRVDFMNRYFAGTLLPRIELDVVPAMGCAAHFFIVADRSPQGIEDYLSGGRAMQRIWLMAAVRGLQFQPEMTPLIFSEYTRHNIRFTEDDKALRAASTLRAGLVDLIGEHRLDAALFAGRLGYGKTPKARSVRLPVQRLLIDT